MKKIIIVSVAIAAVIAILAFRTVNKPVQEEATVKAGDKVEVFYFHLTRRCVTCMAVENETRKSLEELYPDLMKKGTVSFASINLEEESSKAVAERCKVTGQTLLVVSGDVRIDLTDKGFMYATTSPEKLKEEIKKAISPLLNPVK
ncbi:MAG: nitrophenyl compound nitroreductase subunit ArsF family protein [Bacteroidales bacterium]|nr:nitrophenyl compound nitroreductase subunit ArsF family protein [Bacteroidales bacterium]